MRPHTPSAVNGGAYSYDANGNLTSGGGRTYTWAGLNRPATITSGGVTETYSYDADGGRVKKVRSGVTTLYDEGLWEEVAGGSSQILYAFNGQVVAVRESGTNVLTYLHSDHLGSVSVATTNNQAIASQQEYTPWGTHRSGNITQTTLDYTGQRLDSTGLLYYNARYYDPGLGRFISADTIVPGSGPLTIAPNDSVAAGVWATGGGGPANPQNLNRYAYALNNPVKHTDPTGHCIFLAGVDALLCIGGAILVGGALAAIATSPNSGFNPNDYDWTDWSIPGWGTETNAQPATAPTTTDPAVDVPGPVVVPHDTQRQAKRAADRQAGIGRHGAREPLPDETLRPGSEAPQGDPGVRPRYRNPNNGAVVHHDPYGHDYGDTTIGPHYGVNYPPVRGQKSRTTHHTYPSKQRSE